MLLEKRGFLEGLHKLGNPSHQSKCTARPTGPGTLHLRRTACCTHAWVGRPLGVQQATPPGPGISQKVRARNPADHQLTNPPQSSPSPPQQHGHAAVQPRPGPVRSGLPLSLWRRGVFVVVVVTVGFCAGLPAGGKSLIKSWAGGGVEGGLAAPSLPPPTPAPQ